MWIDQRGSEILGRPECLRLLALEAEAGGVGRLAVSREGAPLVRPVNFAYHGGELLVLLGDGYLGEVVPDQLVAFEIDRVDTTAGLAWSVLVRGYARRLHPEADFGAGAWPRPLAPIPGDRLVAIRTDVVSGRRFPLVGVPGAARSDPGGSAVPA